MAASKSIWLAALLMAARAEAGMLFPTHAVEYFPVPTQGAYNSAIVAGPDGAIWFSENSQNRIGRFSLLSGFQEFATPTRSSGPGLLTAGSDGNVWFTEYSAHAIGRITPTGTITEFFTICAFMSPKISVRKSSGRSDQRKPPRATLPPRK